MAKLLEWEDLTFPEKVAIKSKSEKSFLNFTRIWFELLQGDRMLVNWHHRMMSSKVDELISRTLTPGNLIVNIPPGGTKTEFFSIHLPAYINTQVAAGQLKRFRNLNVSFADTLVKRNSRRTRDIIASKEYQELWACKFGVNQAEEWEIINVKGQSIGQTVSRGSGGQITGGRAGYIGKDFSGFVCLDDYNKPEDMFSLSRRDSANRKLSNTLRSRRGDKSKDHPTPFVSIQQRLHVNDATGFMLSGGMGLDFHHVSIPALVSEEFIESLVEPWRTQCWKDVKNSESIVVSGVRYWSYWPQNEYIGDLLQLWESDEYTFLSQYMQAPRALTGNLIDTAWFQRYTCLPPLTHRAIYVDTNSGKVNDFNDHTVFTLVGVDKEGNLYLIDSVRGKWDPEDLLKTAVELWDKWKPYNRKRPAPLRFMGIEDKQAGQGLITTLKKRKKIPILEIPRGDGQNKLVRCLNSIPMMKTGRVFIPALMTNDGEKITQVYYWDGTPAANTDWVMAALAECSDFSADDSHKNDDMLDTFMDAIDIELINGGNVPYSSWVK